MKFSNINLNYSLVEEDLTDSNFAKFMDEITDIPSRELSGKLEEAGIINQNISIKIKDFFGEPISTVYCDLKLCVSLESHRGIHMSRIEEALFSLSEVVHDSLESFACELSTRIRDLQSANISIVEISAITFLGRKTRKTAKFSRDKVNLYCKVVNSNGELAISKGVQAYNITACPCTATYTKFHTTPALKAYGFSIKDINFILENVVTGTHTQRGKVVLIVCDLPEDSNVSFESIYNVIDHSTHLVHELLKRPDEHDLVIRALKSPQFTEDVVRDIASCLIDELANDIPDTNTVFVESTQLDSIHIHDVYSKITRSFGELKTERLNQLPK